MQQTKKTLVLGASLNENRASNSCAHLLQDAGIPHYLFGLRKGQIGDSEVHKEWPQNECFDTVTLYVNPKNQEAYQQQILDLKPLRVIFNPGTENPDFKSILNDHDIETVAACSLVLLKTNQY